MARIEIVDFALELDVERVVDFFDEIFHVVELLVKFAAILLDFVDDHLLDGGELGVSPEGEVVDGEGRTKDLVGEVCFHHFDFLDLGIEEELHFY